MLDEYYLYRGCSDDGLPTRAVEPLQPLPVRGVEHQVAIARDTLGHGQVGALVAEYRREGAAQSPEDREDHENKKGQQNGGGAGSGIIHT